MEEKVRVYFGDYIERQLDKREARFAEELANIVSNTEVFGKIIEASIRCTRGVIDERRA